MDRLLQNETFVRVLSLVVAIAVYLVSQGAASGTIERGISGVPVTWTGLGAGLAVGSLQPTTVTVTVTGAAALVNALNTTGVSASVNLAGANPGDKPYFVQVFLPPGLQFVATTPADVSVIVEAIQTQQFQVSVQTSGTPAKGFGVTGTPTVAGSPVVVSGPASAMQQVVGVVATVPVSSASSDFTVSATPVPVDAAGKPIAGVTVTPAQVQVSVAIGAIVPQKVVPVQVQEQGTPATGFVVAGVSASPAQVTLLGPQGVLAGITGATAQAVSVAGATGTVRQNVGIIEPPGLTGVVPSEVTVTVTIARGK